MIPTQFTSGLPMGSGITQQAGAFIVPALEGSARNVFTMLDNIGMYLDMERWEGESLTNFRARVQEAQIRRGGSNPNDLTDGISVALGLGQENMARLEAAADYRVDVTDVNITVSGNGVYTIIDLVELDPDGFWLFPTINEVVSGLNDIADLTATYYANVSGMPAMLLERQSSYITVAGEAVPRVKTWNLGFFESEPVGKVIVDQVDFTQVNIFTTRISGIVSAPGEWMVTDEGTVTSFDIPDRVGFVNYTYNIITSGVSMDLVGNGAKVFNLADSGVQGKLFYASGLGAEAVDITRDIRNADRLFWGK